MKWIKLFDSFYSFSRELTDDIIENNKNAIDVYEDIKTISYQLEDIGYDLKYYFSFGNLNRFECDRYIENEMRYRPDFTDYDRFYNIKSIEIDIVCNKLTPKLPFFNRKKVNLDINRFLNLLKEHLDYLNKINIVKDKDDFNNDIRDVYIKNAKYMSKIEVKL